MARFTIDSTAPSILSLSVENKIYVTSDIPLTLTTNESVSQVTYSLDGQTNVTAAGNTTLTNLPYGEHSITVYAADNEGNIGAPKTTYFHIFPTALVAVAVLVAVMAGVGLLVYFRKGKNWEKLGDKESDYSSSPFGHGNSFVKTVPFQKTSLL